MIEESESQAQTDDAAATGPAPSADDHGHTQGAEPPVVRARHARVLTEEHWEVMKAELLPMFMERRTLREISEAFGVSENTAGAWRARLIDDLRNEMSALEARDYLMGIITSLQLARTEAWRSVRASGSIKERRAGLQLVAQIEHQFVKLGGMISLYGRPGEAPLQRDATEVDENVRRLHSMIERVLGGETMGFDLPQGPVGTDMEPP